MADNDSLNDESLSEETPTPTKKTRAKKAPKVKVESSSESNDDETSAPPATAKKAKAKKDKDVLLQPESNPRAPFDVARFFSAARPVLALLEKDLLERARASRGVSSALLERHAEEVAAHHTADDLDSWQRQLVRQIAAAWILSCVFVRVLEDRGLLTRNRIAGPGAEDSEKAFYGIAPSLTPRDYLRTTFRELSSFPAGAALFDARHNPVWLLGPSAEASRALLALFRAPDADAPSLRFGEADTRFLGDLYQDLSEDVRERFALLQTPAFVERYILDRTLEPAIARFGLEETTLLDPTCGSGHFLLGAFDRLFEHWQRERPSDDRKKALAESLSRVYGADLNPYAIAIARFRLTLAAIEKGGFTRFADVPSLPLNLVVADSLLHGPLPVQGGGAQTGFFDIAGESAAVWQGRIFALEDDEAAKRVLNRPHAAVVGNPPYIVVRDAALRDEYRKHYPSAYRQFSLGVPFTEKFFLLARKKGYVGMITANSFMKREFGKKLIESWVPANNVTGIINTAGAYIPGHGTPTVILFGTNEPPQTPHVWGVLGKRGEPSTPENASEGHVWSSIRDHGEEPLFENEYISVAELDRKTLAKHPWSLGGGGAAELKELLEERAPHRLVELVDAIGRTTHTGQDALYIGPPHCFERLGVEAQHILPLVEGEGVRDRSISETQRIVFPYSATLQAVLSPGMERVLWPHRTHLWLRREPNGDHREIGLTWFEWSRFQRERFQSELVLTYAEVATHNHFVLDRGGKVFKQTAPIIKLKADASEDDHYALLAYLNSSTACFWMKQVFQPKHSAEHKTHPDPERNRYQVAATGLGQLPMPKFGGSASALAELGRFADSTAQAMSQASAACDWSKAEGLREALVYAQEEIDWLTYALFEMAPMPPTSALGARVRRGDRPFERVHGRRTFVREFGTASDTATAEFTSETKLDPSLEETWAKRIEVLNTSESVGLLEQALFKRQFRDTDANQTEPAYRKEREVEKSDSAWGTEAEGKFTSPQLRSRADLDPEVSRESRRLDESSVPYLAALRYTPKGLEKRAVWERTWELQRREDAGEPVGDIPVPPKYDPKDFQKPAYYRLRGKLDVPKERFISYPGCESDDDKQPLYGWAGWTHLEQAQALAALYEERKREGWPPQRLRPMLEGLRELIPWLKQWHNEPSEEFGGLKLGEYFEGYVEAELRG